MESMSSTKKARMALSWNKERSLQHTSCIPPPAQLDMSNPHFLGTSPLSRGIHWYMPDVSLSRIGAALPHPVDCRRISLSPNDVLEPFTAETKICSNTSHLHLCGFVHANFRRTPRDALNGPSDEAPLVCISYTARGAAATVRYIYPACGVDVAVQAGLRVTTCRRAYDRQSWEHCTQRHCSVVWVGLVVATEECNEKRCIPQLTMSARCQQHE